MKTKEILYDEIITEYNGQPFKQGEIRYRFLNREDVPGLTRVEGDLNMAIMKDDIDDFIKDLTKVVSKYAK